MKFSLSTGTLYTYPLRWVFRLVRETGFDGVELVVNPEAIRRRGKGMQRLAQAEGVEILTVHPTVIPLAGWRERYGGMARTIQLAREAGAGLVIMHTPRSESLEEGEGQAFRQQIEAWQGELAGGYLRLAVENKAVRHERHRRYALTPLTQLRAFADRYDLGLVLDTTHAGSAGEDLLNARQVFDSRLANVHLSDMGGRVPLARLPGAQVLLGQHRLPGDGDLALPALLADLSRTGYAGPLTLEVNPWVAHAWWPPAVRRRLAQAIAWMKDKVAVGTLLAVFLLGHFWLW